MTFCHIWIFTFHHSSKSSGLAWLPTAHILVANMYISLQLNLEILEAHTKF